MNRTECRFIRRFGPGTGDSFVRWNRPAAEVELWGGKNSQCDVFLLFWGSAMSPVLVVEDEYFVADDCVNEVRKRGLEVMAAATLEDAIEYAQAPGISGALIDIDLRGEKAFELIHILRERMIPFVIYTGYSAEFFSKELSSIPLFQKPTQISDVVDVLVSLMHAS
jgi:ActR/RegA family two-component response regulator